MMYIFDAFCIGDIHIFDQVFIAVRGEDKVNSLLFFTLALAKEYAEEDEDNVDFKRH